MPSSRTLLLCATAFVALLVAVVPARAQDLEVDPWAPERKACVDLRFEAKYEEAFDCMVGLWTDHRGEMSREGQIDLLQNMAEMYILYAGSKGEARRCYEHILAIDPHWMPEQFDHWPTSFRQPVIEAYEQRGYLMRSPELRNIAITAVIVSDTVQDDVDLGVVETALPDFLSGYLHRVLEDARLKGDGIPLRVLNTRERRQLLSEAKGADLELTSESPAQAAAAGRQLAVQGLLDGAVLRYGDGQVHVTLRLTRVETAEVIGAATRSGKEDKLFPVMQQALQDLVKDVFDGARLEDEDGPAELGPMGQGVLVLERYHEALRLAEEEKFGEAIDLTLQALELRPEAQDLRQFLQHLQEQQDYAGLALRTDSQVDLQTIDLQ